MRVLPRETISMNTIVWAMERTTKIIKPQADVTFVKIVLAIEMRWKKLVR